MLLIMNYQIGVLSVWRKPQYPLHLYRHFASKFTWSEPSGFNTGISIYNPVVKHKVPLIIKNPNYATWYMCGPTVYDSAHIGHACCYVKMDIIRRILLNFFDINVVSVMGVTDIDDKIIARASELNIDTTAVARKYEEEFFLDISKLNVLPPTVAIRVTDIMPDIISFIESLLAKGIAYKVESGSVYFDTQQYSHYGKLVNVVHEDILQMSEKKSPQDFALWKASKPNEPFWLTSWGKGRPGWHIECSAIASSIFGSNIDMHSGGIDLIFPHHENEEAQSCAYHNTNQWVNYWLHTGHLHLTGDEKMSKSLKNTINIHQFLSSNSSNDFRLYCLLSNYRHKMEYSEIALQKAKSISSKIESFLSDCNAYMKVLKVGGCVNEPLLLQALAKTKCDFTAALCDDFNTAKAMEALMNLISISNKMLQSQENTDMQPSRSPGVIAAVSIYIQQSLSQLGVQISSQYTHAEDISTTGIIMDSVLNFRSQVRQMAISCASSKDSNDLMKGNGKHLLKVCDQLRHDLSVAGIHIKDHGKQSSWTIQK